MAVAALAILWLSRGTTFWIDELAWVLQTPHLGLRGALEPHQGHLVLFPRVVYKLLLGAFGTSYLPFRLLATASVLLTVGLLFACCRRCVSGLVALAPCLVLLCFGSDFLHVIVGNAFTVLLAVSCGLGALLALRRGDRGGDLGACALLCLGLATYSTALAFLAGAAVAIGLRQDRWRRAWVVAVPLVLYAAWWIWSRGHGNGEGEGIHPGQLLLLPAWGFQSLSALLAALSGLDYEFSSDASTGIGPVLAVLALAGFGWRLRRGATPGLWTALAVVVALWALGALTAGPSRAPDQARYLYPGAVALLLLASEALAGQRWNRAALIALYAVAAAGLGANLFLLHERGTQLRDEYAVQVHAAFGALGLAGAHALADFEPPSIGAEGFIVGGQSPLSFPFEAINGGSPTADYREVVQRYGSLGFTPAEIESEPEAVRVQVDAVLTAALGLGLKPLEALPASGCRLLRAGPGGLAVTTLPPGGVAVAAVGGSGEASLRRFADAATQPLGGLQAGKPLRLEIPADVNSDERPWTLAASSPWLRVCPIQ